MLGCGGEPAAPANPRSTPETARLQALLGTRPEMPAGFSDRARDHWQPPFTPSSGTCRKVFAFFSGRPPKEELSAASAVTYQGDGVGSMAVVSLAVYRGNESARQLDVLRGALDRCPTADDTTPGAGNRLTSATLAVNEDGWVTRRLKGRVGGYPYEMHVVLARQGRTLVGLMNAGVRAPDVKRTEELGRLFVAKVGTLDL
ncbi:hypothetical protein Acor_39140 [Acrocarpospora corrugata]|uniref:PknH-like extracellular domain-containing protein n=1 Tax=Acrocarpospora corrugata TaxID=35763 RepID=A0A5M3W0P8_9ACTN|nr:hypothetical protein Acor_39140 [Acrocarpospora corrugata]